MRLFNLYLEYSEEFDGYVVSGTTTHLIFADNEIEARQIAFFNDNNAGWLDSSLGHLEEIPIEPGIIDTGWETPPTFSNI
jgi:hypothetical protein